MPRQTNGRTSSIEARRYRELARTDFEPIILGSIEYQSKETVLHLWMDNIARSMLAAPKAELAATMRDLLNDGQTSDEFRSALLDAKTWFQDQAELIGIALARSAVVCAKNLMEEESS